MILLNRCTPYTAVATLVHDHTAYMSVELAFRNEWRGEGAFSFQAEGKFPKLSWFGVIEDHHHVPNATRLAFAVESREDVDRLAEVIRAAGAINVEGPEDMPYTRVYYAVYFEDPSGNRLEIYYCAE